MEGAAMMAAPPAMLAGRLEVRGLGLLEGLPWQRSALALVAQVSVDKDVPRLPEPARWPLLGHSLPLLRLDGRAPSAPDVLARALDVLAGRVGMTAGAFSA